MAAIQVARPFTRVSETQLTLQQQRHLKLARAIADALFERDKIKGVYAANIYTRDVRGKKSQGLYNRKTWEVFLSPEMLDRVLLTVAMLIHELAHHVSDAEDLTAEFQFGLQEVGTKLMRLTSQGIFDAELREAKW